MGSQLEDALRAAAAAARRSKSADPPPAKAAAQPVATASAVLAMASPGRDGKKRANKRRRSRSDSMASEDDPVKRIAAFQKRIFDVGTDISAPSAAFAGAAKSADEIVKVQWKTKGSVATKRTNGLANLRENDDDDDAVPQLTRARAVATPVPQTAEAAGKSDTKKKTKKKKTTPRVTTVQPPLTPMPTATARAPVRTNKTMASAPAHRDDDALEFSEPSENDDTDSITNGTALAAANVAARNAQQVKLPTAAKPVKKGIRVVKPKATTAVAASSLRKPQVVQRLQNGVLTHKTSSSAQATSNGKKSDTKTLDRSGSQSLKKPAAMMTKTLSSPPRDHADDDDDKWDLDALVKKTVGKAVGKKTERGTSGQSDDDADGNVADPEDAGHDYSDSEFVGKQFRNHQMHLFSLLIDEAARERWELVEVGRLVRIFAAQWGHKKKKTARFLRRCCPELVNVEFLEGMNIPLDTKQLLKIFERGSGAPVVVMNKIASAVENGNMTVRDEDLQSFIVDQTQLMPTNRDIVEFLLPLLESLSKVKDVGVLLRAICEHWHVDRTAALVQDILLTPVFDDLDGQPDVILEDLPALEGRLDFPSCMDDEDADENGNLKGLIVGEESDLGESDAHPEDAAEEELGEVESDEEDGNDSHAEDGVYEGETDSEEEREAQERVNPTKRRRSRFILDEADEDEGGDGSGDDFLADEDEGEDDDSDSSGDSSNDEGESTKPQRKRLRKG